MTDDTPDEIPRMQRIYDRIWWLALAAFLFWLVAYVLWGTFDIVTLGVAG